MNAPASPRVALLGPQSPAPVLKDALKQMGASGPYAAITAGWRNAEGETAALAEHISANVRDLAIYHRVEDIFSRDPTLFSAHRERQDTLKQLQRLYRIRLKAGAEAVFRLQRSDANEQLLTSQLRAAIRQLRTIDRFHARQIEAVHTEFEQRITPVARPAVQAHRREIAALLEKAGAVLISGGHVAVLASRMRLLGMREILSTHDLIAWSAGAMVLTDRIVLFHDHAPEGRREPELLDVGLGHCRGVVALPSASLRLDMANHDQLRLTARRFAPARCLLLDEGAYGVFEGKRISAARKLARIDRDGRTKMVHADA